MADDVQHAGTVDFFLNRMCTVPSQSSSVGISLAASQKWASRVHDEQAQRSRDLEQCEMCVRVHVSEYKS